MRKTKRGYNVKGNKISVCVCINNEMRDKERERG